MGLLSWASGEQECLVVKLLIPSVLTPSTPGRVQKGEEPGASLGDSIQNAER